MEQVTKITQYAGLVLDTYLLSNLRELAENNFIKTILNKNLHYID